MKAEQLEALFPLHVVAACGSCTAPTVRAYRELSLEETPMNFSTWAEKRQREYRAGRHFAHLALGRLASPTAPPPPAIVRDEDGVPIFPAGFTGSITHTGRRETFAAAVIAEGGTALGIDAEYRASWSANLSKRILRPEEESTLHRQADSLLKLNAPDNAGLIAFSAKEAFYKCIFPHARTRLDFHDVDFRLLSENDFVIRVLKPHGSLPQSLEGRFLLTDRLVACGVSWRLSGA